MLRSSSATGAARGVHRPRRRLLSPAGRAAPLRCLRRGEEDLQTGSRGWRAAAPRSPVSASGCGAARTALVPGGRLAQCRSLSSPRCAVPPFGRHTALAIVRRPCSHSVLSSAWSDCALSTTVTCVSDPLFTTYSRHPYFHHCCITLPSQLTQPHGVLPRCFMCL